MAEQKEFLYRLRTVRPDLLETGPTPEENTVIEEHSAYLGDLTERGVVILAGRTQTTGPDTMGIVVLRAADEAAARRIMAADPAVREQVMRAELFPFRVAWRQGG